MTVSDQSTTTGFSDSQPVIQHQRETSDNSTLSGVPSGEMPGRPGAHALPPHMSRTMLGWRQAEAFMREGLRAHEPLQDIRPGTVRYNRQQFLVCAAGGTLATLNAASLGGGVPHASLESTGLSGITGETDSSQSLADSIFGTPGPVMSAPEAVSSEALAAMAASMAQASQSSLWNTEDLAARYCHLATPMPCSLSCCRMFCAASHATSSALVVHICALVYHTSQDACLKGECFMASCGCSAPSA